MNRVISRETKGEIRRVSGLTLGEARRYNLHLMANLDAVLTQLKEERNRLNQAITALEGVTSNGSPRKANRGGSRVMSAAARKRIAAAQRKRWAAFRKQQKAA